MNLGKYISYILITVLGAFLMWSCEDDFPVIDGGDTDGSMTDLAVSVGFDRENQVDISSRAMTAQNGDAMQDLNTFWMVVYRQDGSLYKKYHLREDGSNVYEHPGEISDIRYNGESDNRLPQEDNLGDNKAGQLKFQLRLPSDRYYIYGVANVKDFGNKDISTRDRLKNIECQWDSTAIVGNSEMFGIFSIGQNRNASDVNPVSVTVRDGQVNQLHCWMRRLASKVTVAFDGSELYDNVEVYIDTIMVCDVARKCLLGMPNHPGMADAADPETRYAADQRYDVPNGVYRIGGIQEVQKIETSDLSMIGPQNYYHICNSSHIYGGEGSVEATSPSINEHRHAHTSASLFFYENLQGKGKDKTQSLDGTTIWKPEPKENDLESGWKDGKAYGTYIEVRGYYRCTAPDGSVSAGWIKYRFMLGQDAKNDYDVMRNTHYKVTLKLRGYGNDYDWHIDYKEETGIYMTSPQFISYLYNKSMYATVKIVGEIEPGTVVRADILENKDSKFVEWGPWGDNKANANGSIPYPDPSGVYINGNKLYRVSGLDSRAKGPWTSFLSLRKTSVLRIEPAESNPIQSWQLSESTALDCLKDNYEDNNKGWREYAINASDVPQEDDTDGRYTLQETRKKKLEDGSEVVTERLYRIPLFTRAKELVTKTGFTGNNPYVAYPRKMTVRFTARIRDEITGKFTDRYFDLDVLQVRRIVNPKGVWRKSGGTDPFEVTLLRKPKDDAADFVPFESVGKWSAEVVSQSDPVISLSSTARGSGNSMAQNNLRRIEGEDEHVVNFKINFNGASSGYAIVRVRYHNYTCEHDIFCMVGMDPVQLDPSKNIWWMPSNVYRFDTDGTAHYAESPLQEGALFRRGSLTAITPDNNPVDAPQPSTSDNPSFSVLVAGSTTKTSRTWNQCRVSRSDSRFSNWTIKNTDERIADCETDYYTLTSPSGNLDFPIQKGYGVLYGEGADSAAYKLLDAYGYDSESGASSPKGMLGVFVYNKDNAKTIFMPIGKAGHGRRKGLVAWSPGPDKKGSLRYASRSEYNNGGVAHMIPMLLDLYRRPGALYWCEKYYTKDDDVYLKDDNGKFLQIGNSKVFNVTRSSAFDINFFSMGFEGFSNAAIKENDNTGESDACFIRTVRTKPK